MTTAPRAPETMSSSRSPSSAVSSAAGRSGARACRSPGHVAGGLTPCAGGGSAHRASGSVARRRGSSRAPARWDRFGRLQCLSRRLTPPRFLTRRFRHRKVEALAHVAAEQPHLVDRLVRARAPQSRRPVGGQQHERDARSATPRPGAGKSSAAAVPLVHAIATGRRHAFAMPEREERADRSSRWTCTRTPACARQRQRERCRTRPGRERTRGDAARRRARPPMRRRTRERRRPDAHQRPPIRFPGCSGPRRRVRQREPERERQPARRVQTRGPGQDGDQVAARRGSRTRSIGLIAGSTR